MTLSKTFCTVNIVSLLPFKTKSLDVVCLHIATMLHSAMAKWSVPMLQRATVSKHHLEHSKLCGQALEPDQLHKMVQMCDAKHDRCEQHCVCPAEALQNELRSEASTQVGHTKPCIFV